MNKTLLIITISIVAVCAALFFANQICQKNKEQIVDLGNGWKSYSHEEIGITVKIPEDAEVKTETTGDKNEVFSAVFSKGDISKVGATRGYGIDDPDNLEKINEYYSGRCDENDKWSGNQYTISRGWCEKVMIDGKIVVFKFSEAIYKSKNRIELEIAGVNVLGEKRKHFILLNPDITSYSEEITEEHSQFAEEEINNFEEEKIRLVKDLVLSINNF